MKKVKKRSEKPEGRKNFSADLRELLRDRQGEGYIRTCVILMLVCMLLSAVMFYSSCLDSAKNVKTGVEEVLDGALKRSFASGSLILDDGDGKGEPDFGADFEELFENYFSGAVQESDLSYSLYSSDGSLLWNMSKPVLTYEKGGKTTLTAAFTLSIPVHFAGERLTDVKLSLRVGRSYVNKED